MTGQQDLANAVVNSPDQTAGYIENDRFYSVALYELGSAYEFGRRGVSRDNARAIYWYQEAAERGNVEAQYWLGLKYERGHDPPKDIDKALFWLRRAAAYDQSELVQNSAERESVRLKRHAHQ